MRKIIRLNGHWKLNGFIFGEGENLGAKDIFSDDRNWLNAQVPGDVHLDLRREKKISDPNYGLNSEKCRWVEDLDWWYRKRFFIPGSWRMSKDRQVRLVFEGLDTFATVWMNGKKIGTHRNMFTRAVFDVTELVRQNADNWVVVRLASPIKSVRNQMQGYRTPDPRPTYNDPRERRFTRKAAISYGWDIGPRLLTVGIWKDVQLELVSGPQIIDLQVKSDLLTDGTARVKVVVNLTEVEPASKEVFLSIRLADKKKVVSEVVSVPPLRKRQRVEAGLTLSNPDFWYTHDRGIPHLYDLSVALKQGNEICDQRRIKIGIRSLKLIQEPQSDKGTSFFFQLNGKPIFIRGINWSPADTIFSRITPARYKRLIRFAKELNVNMIRVWGGGIYEPDIFYEICDREGILVWQDFMFACTVYPQDREFQKQVTGEAEEVIKNLRNHPSLALWCGDNEVDWAYAWEFRKDSYLDDKIKRIVLPKTCKKLDQERPYIPSSPHSPSGNPDPNYPLDGDAHLWYFSASYKNPLYLENKSRFVSEIGMWGLPTKETLEGCLPPESRWPPGNIVWRHHFGEDYQRNYHTEFTDNHDNMLRLFWGKIPDTLDEYLFVSQLYQAVALKTWVEQCRRRKFTCGGIILWNLADSWPQISAALIDYNLLPKLSFYAVKRAFSPILVSFEEREHGEIGVWYINDTTSTVSASLSINLVDFAGNVFWKREEGIILKSNYAVPGLNFCLSELPLSCSKQAYLKASLLENGRVLNENYLPLIDYRYIPADIIKKIICNTKRLKQD